MTGIKISVRGTFGNGRTREVSSSCVSEYGMPQLDTVEFKRRVVTEILPSCERIKKITVIVEVKANGKATSRAQEFHAHSIPVCAESVFMLCDRVLSDAMDFIIKNN